MRLHEIDAIKVDVWTFNRAGMHMEIRGLD